MPTDQDTPREALGRKLTKEERDSAVACGMAIAAGIAVSAYDAPHVAKEILMAGGIDTVAKLRKQGVDDYDIDLLNGVLREIARHRRVDRQRAGRAALAGEPRHGA